MDPVLQSISERRGTVMERAEPCFHIAHLAGAIACLGIAAVVVFSSQAVAVPATYFSSKGIAFAYPSYWYVSTRPISNGVSPVYRFAVGNFRFHRTPRDIGPCLRGIAKQRPVTGVLAFMREAVGGDARRPRAGPRPKTFRLPGRIEQAACLGPGSTQFTFTQANRVFYLWISVAPGAPKTARKQIQRLLASMKIAKDGARD
jgi:hypothetical protein